uniref:Protein kinase domain-containing protein n=1 Tax=Ganoderma boninense TaxID=34458 RepID=A0A5K1JUB7_9APHY|nr:Protein kinase domain-containing protein [Ganoderma boninense]
MLTQYTSSHRLPAPPTDDPPLTPLYDSLTTNLPHPVMAYTSFPFPPGTALFPPASTVLKYLEDYAAHFDLTQHVQLNTSVTSVTRDHIAGKWTVTVRNTETPTEETHEFDYIIVANGHYRVPRFPATPGLEAWVEAKKALHSVHYRNPSVFGDVKTIVVVGGGPSGQDLVSDLLAAGKNVIHSVTGAAREDLHDGRLKVRGRIARYGDLDAGRIAFEDGSEESSVDRAALATGYKFDFPFFPAEVCARPSRPRCRLSPGRCTTRRTTRSRWRSTYSRWSVRTSSRRRPSRSWLPIRVAPLPLLEAQMRAVVRVFEHPEILDPTQEAIDIVSRYEALRARVLPSRSLASASLASSPPSDAPSGEEEISLADLDCTPGATADDRVELAIASAWHRFDGHEQFAYRDTLHAFAGYSRPGAPRGGWRDLERLGEADEWVNGVGVGEGEEGTKEWVEMMRRLLRRAEEKHHGLSRL